MGGLIGYGTSDSAESVLSDSISSAQISAEYLVGGLAGRLDFIGVVSCSNEGSSVTATGYCIEGTEYYTYLGGYLGYGYTVTDCENGVSLSYSGKGSRIGGIAGYLQHTFSFCTNRGKITAPQCQYVGGLVGYAHVTEGGTVEQNRNTGSVVGYERVGGIAGELCAEGTGDCTLNLKKQNNSGSVGGLQYVGGIAGYLHAQSSRNYASPTYTILASELNNMGEVQGGENVGGLAGYAGTDSVSSALTGYQSLGAVQGGGTHSSKIFAELSNFIIHD